MPSFNWTDLLPGAKARFNGTRDCAVPFDLESLFNLVLICVPALHGAITPDLSPESCLQQSSWLFARETSCQFARGPGQGLTARQDDLKTTESEHLSKQQLREKASSTLTCDESGRPFCGFSCHNPLQGSLLMPGDRELRHPKGLSCINKPYQTFPLKPFTTRMHALLLP